MQAEKRNVIWVASYPKSGNTWIHDVLRTAGKTRGFPQGPMDIYDMIQTGRKPEICEAVHPDFARHPASVLKTHSLLVDGKPPHVVEGLDLETAAFIYVSRNPLDLLLSYVNFTRLEYMARRDDAEYARGLFQELLGMPAPMPCEQWSALTIDDMPRPALDHALGVFSDRGLTLPTCFPNMSWSSHVRTWLEASSRIPSIVVKYEDCVTDPGTFIPMARFFNFGEIDIRMALDSSAGRAKVALTSGTREERIFFNKMQAYYYPRYFSAVAVKRFIGRHGDALEEFGYGRIVAASTSGSS